MTQTSAESWQRLEHIFKRALERAESDQSEFIDRQCAGDAALAARIRHMLNAHRSNGKLLDSSPIDILPAFSAAAAATPTLAGRRIGSYSITNVIATGGMGTVYLAQQEHPRRRVALKVMLGAALGTPALHATSRSSRRRFEIEADLLGRLQHPAIAQVYEAGMFESDEGPQPYFAMEYIEGRPITEFAQQRRMNVHQRLGLLQKVCEGVHHAHGRGVIHRDLKPSNILVDAAGQPKILDFGIARAIDSSDSAHPRAHPRAHPHHHPINTTLRTAPGQLIGTVAYMSPEQIAGDAAELDQQSDVYALGVLGYELLANRLPHDIANVPLPDALRILREHEPTPLSAVWGSVIDLRTQQMSALRQREVCTIIAKALESDKARRYASAAEFAADIGRFLSDEPVLAQPPSTLYQLRKFARRNKSLVAGIIATLLALSLGLVIASWQWARASHERDAADSARQAALNAEAITRAQLEHSREMALMTMTLANSDLGELPGGTTARERLARSALEQYSTLADSTDAISAGPNTIRGNLAYAHQRVGEALITMGDSRGALQHFQRALQIRQTMLRDDPDDRLALRTLGVSYWKLAESHEILGNVDEARQHNRASLSLYEELADAADGLDLEIDHYIGAAHRRVALCELAANNPAAAIDHFQQSLAAYDQMLKRGPEKIASHQGRALVLFGMAKLFLARGEFDRAVEALQQSTSMVDAIAVKSGPANLWDRTQRAECLLTLANVQRARGEMNDASRSARQAIEIAETLARADAANALSHHLLARALITNSEIQEVLATPAAAEQSRLRAHELLSTLIARDPCNALVQRDLETLTRMAPTN